MRSEPTSSDHPYRPPDAPTASGPRSPRTALVALLLLVPAPSIGALFGMWWFPETTLGTAVYFGSKVWLAALPLVWMWLVDRERPSWSPPRRGGFGVGLGLGIAIAAVIVAAYFVVGTRWIDVESFRQAASENNLGSPANYLFLAIYVCTINAVLEEYVWRWFVFRKCEALVPGKAAVVISALLFTVHHVFALRDQFDWSVTLLASLGVFIGGVLWSWCYLHYRSIWPGWISHVLADIAFLVIGYRMLFGA